MIPLSSRPLSVPFQEISQTSWLVYCPPKFTTQNLCHSMASEQISQSSPFLIKKSECCSSWELIKICKGLCCIFCSSPFLIQKPLCCSSWELIQICKVLCRILYPLFKTSNVLTCSLITDTKSAEKEDDLEYKSCDQGNLWHSFHPSLAAAT